VTETISLLPEQIDTQQLVQQLVDRARAEGVDNTFRYASRRDWDALGKQLRPIYTAPTAAAAVDRFDEFAQAWGGQYPAVVRLWRSAGAPSAQRARVVTASHPQMPRSAVVRSFRRSGQMTR
jgi:transposase-like protein